MIPQDRQSPARRGGSSNVTFPMRQITCSGVWRCLERAWKEVAARDGRALHLPNWRAPRLGFLTPNASSATSSVSLTPTEAKCQVLWLLQKQNGRGRHRPIKIYDMNVGWWQELQSEARSILALFSNNANLQVPSRQSRRSGVLPRAKEKMDTTFAQPFTVAGD